MSAVITDNLTKKELREMKFFGYFSEGVVILKGPAGSGKTMWCTAIAKNLNKYYGKPVVLDYPVKPAFGEATFMDDALFREELGKIGKLAKSNEGVIAEVAENIREKMGIKLDNAVVGWDEAYKKLESRRCSSLYVLVHGYYLQLWRHYHNTVILCTPRFDMIDAKRGLNQVTIELSCSANFRVTPTSVIGPRNPKDWKCRAQGIDRFTMKPLDMTLHAVEYGELYDSWAPVAIRQKLLERLDM